MSTLQERLIEAMGEKSQADLARECGISRTAVSKWFDNTKELKAKHLFKIARACQVDAEWLATGEGKKDRGLAQTRSDAKEIPQSRVDLIRKYGALPKELRFSVRMLIETIAAAGSEKYASWSREVDKFNIVRDENPVKTVEKTKKTTTE